MLYYKSFYTSQIFLNPSRHCLGTSLIPPSPCIGSIITAAVFSLIEFFRSFVLGGFPWNLIVYSLTDYINFIQILSFIGTYSLNLLSVTFFTIPAVFFFNEKLIYKLLIGFITLTLFTLNI